MIAAQNPSQALAVVVVDELARCGVTDAVVAPGSRSTALAMALHDDPRVRLHVQIDERSAGFVALGLARATGRPAVVVTTSGTATANLFPAVVEADASAVPLLALTADRPPELRHTGANQTIDQLGLYGGRVRWFVEVGVPEDRDGAVAYWRSTTARAVAEALGLRGPAGPVHANLAFREPTVPAVDDGRADAGAPFGQPLDGRRDRRGWVTVDPAPAATPDAELEAFAARVAGIERGLIVVGDTTARAGPIHDLAARTGWPVVAEPVSNARFGDHVVAHAGPLLAVEAFAAAHRPDLVVRIGRPTVARSVLGLLDTGTPQVVVDPDGHWHDPTRTMSDLVVADPGLWCASLVRLLAVDTSSEWRERWRAADAAAATAIATVLDAHAEVTEPQVARDVVAAVDDRAALALASSMPIRDVDAFAAPRRHALVVANRGASGIDGFVSTALGVALAHGPTVALAGDLSFLHDRNGLLLSPDAPAIDAVFVVVDNDGGGIFHFLPQADYPASFERVFGTPHGIDLADVARTHRLTYRGLHRASDVAPAVAAATADGGIHLLHARTERGANAALHRDLAESVRAAVVA